MIQSKLVHLLFLLALSMYLLLVTKELKNLKYRNLINNLSLFKAQYYVVVLGDLNIDLLNPTVTESNLFILAMVSHSINNDF